MSDLIRSNRLTAYWTGEGVANGVFYRTHDKLVEAKSDSDEVKALGFVFPTGTEEAPATPAQKLEAYRTFLSINASTFGIAYDPVDRRAEQFKFPAKYTVESFLEFGKKIYEDALIAVLSTVNSNVVAKMIASKEVPEGSVVQYGVGDAVLKSSEAYGNGNLKFAVATIPVVLGIDGKTIELTGEVELVSGQLKKPRNLTADVVLTQTGIKSLLIEKELLPKPAEKPAKEDKVVEGEPVPADNTEATEAPAGRTRSGKKEA